MKQTVALFFAFLPLFVQAQHEESFASRRTLHKDSLVKELTLLYELLNDIHPGEYMHCTKKAFDRHFDSLRNTIQTDLSPVEFYCKIQCLVARIKDGHTHVDHSPVTMYLYSRPVFPFSIYKTPSAYVIRKSGNEELDSLVGFSLLKINGKNIDALVKQAGSFMSIEGMNTTAINSSLQLFPFYYFLMDTAVTFNIQVEGIDGKVKEMPIKGVSYKQFAKRSRFFVDVMGAKFIENNTAVLTIGSFNMDNFAYTKKPYQREFDAFFKNLAKRNITKLVIDLRNNGGGAPEIANYLFSYLAQKPYYYFDYAGEKHMNDAKSKRYDTSPGQLIAIDTAQSKYSNGLYCRQSGYWWYSLQENKKKNLYKGHLVVLVNGGCFSTTGHFLALLKDHGIGTLVGECSQGSYYSNDGSHTFKLPYSGLFVRIPTAQFKLKTTSFVYDPKGICPDIEVAPQPEDFKTGYDRQLNTAIQLLKNQ